MEITEVRIKLMEGSEDRLRAFCSITFDDSFVVRDLKIIEGNNGPFVAMPSRKLTAHCRECNSKNHLRARYCNQCGRRLASDRVEFDQQGRAKLYADVAHPINAECRERIQNRVIEDFFAELELAKQPGYTSRYDDDYESEPWSAELGTKVDVPEARDTEIHKARAETEHAKRESAETGPPGSPQPAATEDSPAAKERGRLKGPHKARETADAEQDAAADNRQKNSEEFGRGIFE